MNLIEKYLKGWKLKLFITVLIFLIIITSLTLQILDISKFKNDAWKTLQLTALVFTFLNFSFVLIWIFWKIIILWKNPTENRETINELDKFAKGIKPKIKQTTLMWGTWVFLITFVFLISLYFMISEYNNKIPLKINFFLTTYSRIIISTPTLFTIIFLTIILFWSLSPKSGINRVICNISRNVIFVFQFSLLNIYIILNAFVDKGLFGFIFLITEFLLLSIAGFVMRFKKESSFFNEIDKQQELKK